MVFQLSDRRLTEIDRRGKRSPAKRPANKAVLWNGRVLFGFTGLASIAGVAVDKWIAEKIAPAGDELHLAVRALRHGLNEAFKRAPQRGQFLAVVMCGFIYDDDVLKPFQAVVSNGANDLYDADNVDLEFGSTFR